jgi:hypothetical protein
MRNSRLGVEHRARWWWWWWRRDSDEPSGWRSRFRRRAGRVGPAGRFRGCPERSRAQALPPARPAAGIALSYRESLPPRSSATLLVGGLGVALAEHSRLAPVEREGGGGGTCQTGQDSLGLGGLARAFPLRQGRRIAGHGQGDRERGPGPCLGVTEALFRPRGQPLGLRDTQQALCLHGRGLAVGVADGIMPGCGGDRTRVGRERGEHSPSWGVLRGA